MSCDEHSVAAQVIAPGFDPAGLNWLPLLCSGGCVRICEESVRTNPSALVTWLAKHRITHAAFASAMTECLLNEQWPEDCALRYLITGGDKLTRGAPQGAPFSLYNVYGPTETAILTTCREVPQGLETPPDIGRPISNQQAYVLNPTTLKPVAIGVPGELYIGGVQLADGYLHLPDKTADSFISNPFCGVS